MIQAALLLPRGVVKVLRESIDKISENFATGEICIHSVKEKLLDRIM